MKHTDKTKQQLISELKTLRRRIAKSKAPAAKSKKAEEKPTRSREEYRAFIQTAPDITYELDADGNFVFVSDAIKKLGYKPEELIGKHFAKIIHPDDIEAVRFSSFAERKGKRKRTGDTRSAKIFDERRTGMRMTRNLEVRLLSKKKKGAPKAYHYGEIYSTATFGVSKRRERISKAHRYAEVQSSGKWDKDVKVKNKTFLGTIGVIRDITYFKEAEEALRKSEEQFRLAFETARDAIFWADSETGLITRCNKAAESLLQKKRVEIIGTHQSTLHPPEKQEYYSDMFKRHVEKKGWVDDEGEVITKGGEVKPVHITASVTAIAGDAIIQGVFRDITERKRAQQALERTEKRFRSLFKYMIGGVAIQKVVVDKNNKPVDLLYVDVNDVFEKQSGLKRNDVIGKRVTELFPGISKTKPDLISLYGKVARTGKPTKLDFYFEPLDRWFSISAYSPQKDHVATVSEDITERRLVAEVVRESEKRYRAVFEQAADSIVLIDTETGELVEFNDKAHENLGYTREEFKKLKIPDFEVIESPEEVTRHIEKVARAGADTFDTKHRTKKGDIRDIHVSSRAISVGGRKFIQSIWRDVTDRKKAEEEIKKFKTIADNANYGMVITDLTGNLLYLNRYLANVHGYIPSQIIGKNLSIFHTKQQLREVAKINKELQKKGSYSALEVWHKHKNGSVFPMLMNGVVIRDEEGKPLFMTATAIDVSERKKAEEELKRAYGDLAKANEELRRLDEMKSRFLSTVSHEFRTPLVVIRSFADILAKKKLGEVTGQQQERLQAVVRQADYLGNLVNNLLDLSRIEAGEVKPEMAPLALERPVEGSVATLLPLAGEKEVEMEIELDANLTPVLGDEDMLIQVFNNLLSNAIKFTPKKGKVTIRAKEVDDRVQVDIADNGIGIPEEQLQKIFEEFHRVPTREARPGWGAGLGLTIVRYLLEEQGGEIWATSELGKGTTFSFSLGRASSSE